MRQPFDAVGPDARDPAGGVSAAYWRDRLAGLGERGGFPADLRPGARSFTGRHTLLLPEPLAERLDRLSRNEPATLHVVLAAALAALLDRYAPAAEVALGCPPLHPPPGSRNTMLVLRTATGGTFRDQLGRMRDTMREALRHQDFPVGEAGGGDHFDVAVELAELHGDAFADRVPVAMLFTGTRDERGPGLLVRYDEAKYLPGTVRRITRHYVRLLELAAAEPDRPLAELDLSTTDDDRAIAAGNATAHEYDTTATIHGLFERQAAATPDAVALLTSGGVRTYAELDRRATRLARTLRRRGVGPDVVVAVLAERSPELVEAILAVLKAGGAYLPIDPAYPPARIAYLLADSDARLCLAQRRFMPLAADVEVLDLDDPDCRDADDSPLDPLGTARDLAYVIYTSGSTGDPKGVLVEHTAVVNRLGWMQRVYPIGAGDVVALKTSICFDVSVWELFWWSWTGAALAVLDPGAEKDPASIVAAVRRHGVTTMHFVPSMLTLFLAHLDRVTDDGDRPLSGMRRVFASGEALPPALVDRFGELVPTAALVNLYGPTEATVDVTHQPCDAPGVAALARVPIGRPIDNARLYVLDEHGHQQPVGIPGELYLAGAGLARGYLGRDELTAERFVDGAAVGEARQVPPGDRARRLADGGLDYLGRTDLQVKVRGFRVEPGEIEARLLSHPAVSAAAVVPRGEGWQTTLRAYVVPAVGASGPASAVGEAALKAYLRESLPEHLVPARVELLDALPLTPHGKLDRQVLSRPGRRQQTPRHVEPRDERELALAGIWRTVLGVPRVGVGDNFFALGGNSIHFVAVLAKARAVGLDFTFQQLFRHQTIAALAAAIADGAPSASPERQPYQPFELLTPADRALVPAGAQDAYPLSLLQAGLIFQTEITGGLGQYHDVLGHLVAGPFDAAAFEEAVRVMVRRHPILRTTYHLTGFGEFVQVVHGPDDLAELPMSIVDLRDRTPDEQRRYNDEWVAREKARPFEWERGALVGLHVQVLAADRYRYTVSQHNSALDGWSISLLHTQLFDTYFRLRQGLAPRPHDLDNHLRNFVGLEREAIASEASRRFWLDVLRDGEPTEVPRRPGAVETADFEVVFHDVVLPHGITRRVVELADALSVPFKDVLLAAHVKVLAMVAGEREVLTGYEHSGRPELPDADAALGLFLNTVPLRVDVGPGTWAELVRRVYEAELDLLPHRRYPMARMKQDLGTRRSLFETTFNYTHFYLLKRLRELPEFALLDMRVDSETEFVFRTEFSRHFFDDELRLCLHYHSHLFDADRIERIGGHFVTVLELMAADPHGRHDALSPVHEPDTVRHRETVPAEPVVSAVDVTAEPSTVDRVASVWAAVLDLPVAELDKASDFFALGGNSLSALRVVLELDGLVTLTDLNRHSRLDEVAGLLQRRQEPEPGGEVLQLLSGTAAGTRGAVVCVPYPCGHPINFGPLAAALEELTGDLAVYGVQAPGHDLATRGEFASVAETARLVLAEIEEKADLPIVLWGHCGGAAVTVELARIMEDAGFDLRHVFVGSKLLPPIADMGESLEMIEGWTDEQIIRFMVDETGYTDLDGLDQEHVRFMASVFRNDVGNGFRYFTDVSRRREWKLATPFTFVVAADDIGLAHYGGEYQRWALLASDVRLRVVGSGGHYFVRTNPAETAGLIERTWQEG